MENDTENKLKSNLNRIERNKITTLDYDPEFKLKSNLNRIESLFWEELKA